MEQDIRPGAVVLSLCGRDAGGHYIVLGTDGVYAGIADGRQRRVERPKRKKHKHLRQVGSVSPEFAAKLAEEAKLSNSGLRKELLAFEAGFM